MPPISVSGSTLNRAANPTPFLSTDVPSQRTVHTTAGLIPTSSWLRYNDDRYAFEGLHHKKDRTTWDSPPPRASSPDFPPPSELMPPSTPLELTRHKQARSEWEAERRDLNQRANAAKEAADADPGNEAKALEYRQLCKDYAADFGLFVPDAEIDKHLILRRQESTRLDGLWEQAFKKGCPVSNRAPLQAYMDAAEEFNATFGQPYQHYDGKAADLTSKCQMLVLYKEFLDGCRSDLEEEFRIVGQRLHEISWVNPFPLGDSRRAALDTKLRARANIAPESNFRSTLEDATVTLTYLNSDYRKPSSVRCRRKYLKHKLLVIELAAMQAAAEVEARQQEVPPTISTAVFYGVVDSLFLGATDLVKTCLIRTRWVVLACCAGSYVLSGMNDWHLEKLGRRVKLEQNCLVRTIWGRQAKLDPRPFRVNKSFTTYPLGVMGHGTWDMGRTRREHDGTSHAMG
ncbi:hypothetical protein B0H14DRAFT_2617387 [Mycena olivaceomarginata]|nr:hypothetical protein B0H14DRAFT_2617387 [Mycena olivaceomarginata]